VLQALGTIWFRFLQKKSKQKFHACVPFKPVGAAGGTLTSNSFRSNADIATLSGGEKSFTQMCLICSLWEVMQPPFRFVIVLFGQTDEY
jgi:hypothetical protein